MSRIYFLLIIILPVFALNSCCQSNSSSDLILPEGTYICCSIPGQRNPEIISDGTGNVLLAWTDSRAESSAIYVQKIDKYLNPQWDPDGVLVSISANNQAIKGITLSTPGEVMIAWAESFLGPDNIEYRLSIQKIDSEGNPVWSETVAAMYSTSVIGYSMLMETDGAGGAVVAWASGMLEEREIHAQRIDSNGALIWGQEGMLLTATPGNNSLKQILPDSQGGAMISWREFGGDTFAQKIDSEGIPRWPSGGIQIQSGKMAPDGLGGAVIVWKNYDDHITYAQRLDSDGEPQWRDNGIALNLYYDESLQINSDGKGNIFIGEIETDYYDPNSLGGDRDDIRILKIDNNGNLLWGADGVYLHNPDHHGYWYFQLIHDGMGGAMMIYMIDGQICVQRIDVDGIAQWPPEGASVVQLSNIYADPVFAPINDYEGYVIVWADPRDSIDFSSEQKRIYGYFFDMNGN